MMLGGCTEMSSTSTEHEIREFDPLGRGHGRQRRKRSASSWPRIQVIVGPDGNVDGKDRFLSLIASGDLSHDVMTTQDLQVRLYGTLPLPLRVVRQAAVIGNTFLPGRRSSCIFVKRAERWACF